MNSGFTKQLDSQALEDVGRATLRIVHDLKNQLNGLKLYATFLRKRIEAEDRPVEERETIAKLVAGLDRAARDMSTLVNYGRPLELRRQPHTDLRMIIEKAAHDPAHRVTDSLHENFASDVESCPFPGAFDPHALVEAFSALTRETLNGARPTDKLQVSLRARKINEEGSPSAVIEWRGLNARPAGEEPGIHGAFAKRVVEAHGGSIDFGPEVIRVQLPLSE